MENYLVMIKCCNCNTSNTIEQTQGQRLPEKIQCRYCKCLTPTTLILGSPADPLEAKKEMGLSVGQDREKQER